MMLGYFWMHAPNITELPQIAVELSTLFPDALFKVVESLLFSW
jgi:hypothetical protein